MSWEVFQGKGSKVSNSPRVTICRSGYLSLNFPAIDAITGSPGPHPVTVGMELSADFSHGLVGVGYSDDPDAYAFRLCGTRYRCKVGAFLDWAGIPTDKARQYRPYAADGGLGIVFKVSEFVDVSREGGAA